MFYLPTISPISTTWQLASLHIAFVDVPVSGWIDRFLASCTKRMVSTAALDDESIVIGNNHQLAWTDNHEFACFFIESKRKCLCARLDVWVRLRTTSLATKTVTAFLAYDYIRTTPIR